MHLGDGVVNGNAARLLLLLFFGVVCREVRRDALPGLSVVARAEKELGADVDGPFLNRTQVDRRVPVVAEFALLVPWQRLEVARFVGFAIDPSDLATLGLGVDIIRIRWICEHPEAVPAVHVLPLVVSDSARIL